MTRRGSRGGRGRNRSINPLHISTGMSAQMGAALPVPVRAALRAPNPTRGQLVVGGVAVAAAATLAYIFFRDDTPAPVRPGGTGLEGAADPGHTSAKCGLDPSYPGFVWDGVDCIPSYLTPPGIYILDECRDFIFVTGDDGPQPDDLEGLIAKAVNVSKLYGGGNVDPSNFVTQFLKSWWPECTWPPAPDASERIVQMYMALSVLTGRMIIARGGRVFNTSSYGEADELLGERFDELGYTQGFRPEIVSEIKLPEPPDATLDPDLLDGNQIDTGGGIDVDEDYHPPQGGIDLPPGGGGPFPQQPPDAGGWDEVPDVNVPSPIDYSDTMALQDDDVRVQLSLANGLPDGTYYMRLDFLAKLRALQYIGGNFSGVMKDVGQRETRNYRIQKNGTGATVTRVGPVFHDTANMVAPQIQQFGCVIPSSCGKLIDANYLSFFNPELKWNNVTHGLDLTFRNHDLVAAACQPANCPNRLDVQATISFSNDGP